MFFYSTLTVSDGSSIDGNTAATVSSPASLSAISSWLTRQGAIGAWSLWNRDFAMLELGDAAFTCMSARSAEEASWCLLLRR